MKVLLVGNHWTQAPGGAETVLVLTADLLRAAGHEVVPFAVAEERTLPTPVRDRLPAAAGAGARTRFGEAWAGTWSPRAYRALAGVVDRVRPDVAHVHHVFERLTVSVLDALRRGGVPTVMTLHDYKPVCPNFRLFTDGAPCTRCLSGRYANVVRHRCLEGSRWRSVAAAADAYASRARGVWSRVDRFVAPSAFLRDRVVDGGLPADRIDVLPNPVVAGAAPRAAAAEPPSVLYASRLVAEKGVHTLLDAAARLPAGVRVRLAGSGRLEAAVRARVAAEGLPVDVLGPLPPARVVSELRAAAVAVLPALWWENCPMAVLEAAAHGVPVVASAVGGIPELVDDGRTGLLVPPGDADTLAGALTRLVRDPGAATRMGRAGWARVRARHDPAGHVAALLEVYRRVGGVP
ncbi:glycosyl transferase family 1 [Geodermatophilus sp. TF02-6]|uniref:glycosyltransferase n=1 Tax=Geodermatophilus sp. TF02-6 TaxID=2250575 RepID=UPI000DE99245|nr:glycosyltransferase [Geodermatophilus sp. TF02-6]RBY82907.1 glycosyl transferase family 1 [Geodermatophilus sp. TF02-6]